MGITYEAAVPTVAGDKVGVLAIDVVVSGAVALELVSSEDWLRDTGGGRVLSGDAEGRRRVRADDYKTLQLPVVDDDEEGEGAWKEVLRRIFIDR